MATQQEKAEHTVSVLMRLGISLVIPVWALIMVLLGIEYRSLWWLGTGLAVGGAGLLLFVGSPLASSALDLREGWRGDGK
ncbi:MAG TPA: hypothetical protein VMU16_10540 [Candidatus Binataceae bacterium]|nr:hypothetical protein [Candidatus Binataceae bacterium]